MNILPLLDLLLYDVTRREDLCFVEGQVSKHDLDQWMKIEHPAAERDYTIAITAWRSPSGVGDGERVHPKNIRGHGNKH